MVRNLGKRPAEARPNAVWGSGKIAGGVAVIAATMALLAPGVANASMYSSRSYSAPVALPPPIAPVVAPSSSDPASVAAVSWGDVSWGDVL